MRDKIKKLWYGAQLGFNNQQCEPEVVEKFAELIIQDCIRQIVKIPTRVEYISGQSFTYIQLGETVETIKVHFGVE